jgi:putative oxidoreductase
MVGAKRGWIARNWMQLPQIPLRIGVGLALLWHSAPMVLTAAGHENFTHMLGEVGLPFPGPNAWAVASLELAGGLALILGFQVTLASILVSLEILVRIVTIYLLGRGFPTPLPGQPALPDYELNLMYVAGMTALVIAGAGYYSFDWSQLHPQHQPTAKPSLRHDAAGRTKAVRKHREGMNV